MLIISLPVSISLCILCVVKEVLDRSALRTYNVLLLLQMMQWFCHHKHPIGDRHSMPLFALHYLPEVPMLGHWYVLDSNIDEIATNKKL